MWGKITRACQIVLLGENRKIQNNAQTKRSSLGAYTYRFRALDRKTARRVFAIRIRVIENKIVLIKKNKKNETKQNTDVDPRQNGSESKRQITVWVFAVPIQTYL